MQRGAKQGKAKLKRLIHDALMEGYMDHREHAIRLWFEMWLTKTDLGISDLFAKDAVYIESWGPEYHGCDKIRHWFYEWNTRGDVLQWKIEHIIHKDKQTVVVWYFESKMYVSDKADSFDGVSLIEWDPNDKIVRLQEFGCNANRYDPYQNGETMDCVDNDEIRWF